MGTSSRIRAAPFQQIGAPSFPPRALSSLCHPAEWTPGGPTMDPTVCLKPRRSPPAARTHWTLRTTDGSVREPTILRPKTISYTRTVSPSGTHWRGLGMGTYLSTAGSKAFPKTEVGDLDTFCSPIHLSAM